MPLRISYSVFRFVSEICNFENKHRQCLHFRSEKKNDLFTLSRGKLTCYKVPYPGAIAYDKVF